MAWLGMTAAWEWAEAGRHGGRRGGIRPMLLLCSACLPPEKELFLLPSFLLSHLLTWKSEMMCVY